MIAKKRGSILVEASIVYPIFFMILMVIIFFALGMYQQSCARYAADTAVRQASYYLLDSSRYDMATGIKNTGAAQLYRRLFSVSNESKTYMHEGDLSNLQSTSADTLKNIELRVVELYKQRSLIQPQAVKVNIKTKNLLIHQQIEISLEAYYGTGVYFIDAILGDAEKGYTVHSNSKATLRDGAEFIRNVDFAGDSVLFMNDLIDPNQSSEFNLRKIQARISDKLSEFTDFLTGN